ncbi:MAG: hypothetical protein BGN84_14070 [Afipia sp. 62-7]|nr:MAG: hypothetical protein BGN84_14070 [Afipia sp. 62-7]
MEKDPRKPQTLALAPVLIFAALLIAVFGAALVTTYDRTPTAVTAADKPPSGTTGMARPNASIQH